MHNFLLKRAGIVRQSYACQRTSINRATFSKTGWFGQKKFSLSLEVASFLRWDHGKGTSLRVACTLLLRLQLECWGQCWAPHYRQDCDTLGTVQGRPERWLKDWSVLGGEAERAVTVQPREEKAQGTDPCVQTPDGRSKEEAARLLPVVPSDRTTGSGQKWEYRKLHAQHPSLHWVLIRHTSPHWRSFISIPCPGPAAVPGDGQAVATAGHHSHPILTDLTGGHRTGMVGEGGHCIAPQDHLSWSYYLISLHHFSMLEQGFMPCSSYA